MSKTGSAVEERMGARPVPGEASGCANCGHPYALHSNGRTPCRAFACTAGPSVGCETCGGTTRTVATGDQCRDCRGTGSVKSPCQAFAESAVPAALAS